MNTKYNRLYKKIIYSNVFLEKSKLTPNEVPDSYHIARTSKNKWIKMVGELIYNETKDQIREDRLYKHLNSRLGDLN